MPDLKLKAAMAEITAIIKKHDLAGSVLIQNENHAEYLYELSPSWSCVTLTEEGFCRIKAAAKTGGPEEKERLRVSVGMIIGFLDHARKQQDNMQALLDMLIAKGLKFEHTTREE